MTNITPETLLKAARIAYPQYEWFVNKTGVYRKIQPYKGPFDDQYFLPDTNNSDQLALWKGLGRYDIGICYFKHADIWEALNILGLVFLALGHTRNLMTVYWQPWR